MASRPKIDDAEPLLADARRARASRVVRTAARNPQGALPADDKTLCRKLKFCAKRGVYNSLLRVKSVSSYRGVPIYCLLTCSQATGSTCLYGRSLARELVLRGAE